LSRIYIFFLDIRHKLLLDAFDLKSTERCKGRALPILANMPYGMSCYLSLGLYQISRFQVKTLTFVPETVIYRYHLCNYSANIHSNRYNLIKSVACLKSVSLKNCLFVRLRCRCENKKCPHTLCMLCFLIFALLVLRRKF